MTTQKVFTAPILLPADPTAALQAATKQYADLKVPATRNVNAGTGLTGGGALSSDVTLTVAYGTTSGSAAQGNDTRITGAEQTTNKAAASGYASLNSSTQVPIAQLPTGTTSSTVAIGNDSRITGAAPTASPTFTGTVTLVHEVITPQTITWASSITPVATSGDAVQITATANTTINAPTSPTSGGMMLIEVLASAGTWTVTLSGITLSTGLTSPFTIASGKVGFFGLRYSGLLSAWVCIAQTNSL